MVGKNQDKGTGLGSNLLLIFNIVEAYNLFAYSKLLCTLHVHKYTVIQTATNLILGTLGVNRKTWADVGVYEFAPIMRPKFI